MPPVVVVGAGICGAATALALHDAGADVLLLEQGEVGQGSSSKGEGNVLKVDAPDGHAAWHELAARFPEAVKLRAKGSITLYEDGQGEDVSHLEPALAPGLTGVFEPDDLQVDPFGTIRAIAAVVPTRTGARVERAQPDGVVLAGGERVAADAVVMATGADAAELGVRPRKGQLLALGPAPGLVRRKLIDGRYPAEVAAVIEEAVTGEVYVGSSRQDTWTVDGFDAELGERMLARAVRFVPALAGLPVTRTWVGFRPYRPGGPFVGRLDSGVWAIGGHEGAGVGNGPADARRLVQALLAS